MHILRPNYLGVGQLSTSFIYIYISSSFIYIYLQREGVKQPPRNYEPARSIAVDSKVLLFISSTQSKGYLVAPTASKVSSRHTVQRQLQQKSEYILSTEFKTILFLVTKSFVGRTWSIREQVHVKICATAHLVLEFTGLFVCAAVIIRQTRYPKKQKKNAIRFSHMCFLKTW